MQLCELFSLSLFFGFGFFSPHLCVDFMELLFFKKKKYLLLVQVPSKADTNNPVSCSENCLRGLWRFILEALGGSRSAQSSQ